MKKFPLIALAALLTAACGQKKTPTTADLPPYLDESQPVEVRVEDALSRMTLEEKVALLHAQSKFSSAGVPRLGIPENWTTDGPHGIRPEVLWDEWDQAGWTNDSCTAFPALTCLAATWDKDLALLYGRSIGEEAKYRGKNVLLGPGVNICRNPLNGRSFEYLGEDPYLAGQLASQYVQGVQSNGVAACVKHYAVNSQEYARYTADSQLDDRTLYEIYLPAFKAAIQEGGAWAIMPGYNLYNGVYCSHSQRLIMDILKGEWGFDGVTISDWGATHSTEEAVENGLDMEFGTWTNGLSGGAVGVYDNYYLANPYLELLRSGKADIETLNDKARRVLRLAMRTTMSSNHSHGSFASPEHSTAARRIGADGIVLLKNEGGILPIPTQGVKKVLVVGENAIKVMTVGGGSSSLKARYEVSPLAGIQAALAGKAEVAYERGYLGSTSDSYNGVSTGVDLSDPRSSVQLIADAVRAAADADYVIFVGGLNKDDHQDCEGADRLSYGLPYGQDAVIEALAAVAQKLVVVNISGNAVAMPWVDRVPAIIQDWYIGSEAGNSLADVLTGKVNPSGKLPVSVAVRYEDGPLRSEAQYPGTVVSVKSMDFGGHTISMPILGVQYSEGIFVGYRWFEHEGIQPLFPFGYGLSYTTFDFGEARLNQASIKAGGTVSLSIPVTNTGQVAGAEVVQLYVSDVEASVPRPVKELKGFDKVFLQPGETATVTFTISTDDLAYFDADAHQWVAEPGEYQLHVGSSSADIKSSVSFELK